MGAFIEFLSENKKTTAQAKAMGLEHLGGGRWGKDGKTLYTTYYGTLMKYEPKGRSSEPVPENPHDQGETLKTPQPNTENPHVYEDENLMVHAKAFDHDLFADKGKSKAEDPCLYNQVLHTIQMKTGASARELMKQYNPVGKQGVGLTLDEIITGFNKTETPNGKVKASIKSMPDDIDSAIQKVRGGDHVICMVHSYGGLYSQIGNPDGSPKMQKLHKQFQASGGVLNPKDANGMLNDTNKDFYHALMLVGVDKAEGVAIFRDSQNDYGYEYIDREYEAQKDGMSDSEKVAFDKKHLKKKQKRGGFIKVPLSFLRKYPQTILKMITLDAKLV